jgi:hypothetical protein
MTLEDQDMITGMQGVQMALVCLMDRQQALYLGYELQDCCVNGNPHSSEKNQLNCKILWEYFFVKLSALLFFFAISFKYCYWVSSSAQ